MVWRIPLTTKIAILNTLYESEFDAGAEKVVKLFLTGLRERGLHTSVVSIAQKTEKPSKQQSSARIATSNVYPPYPHRRHSAGAKLAFHVLENFNPLARHRIAATGLIDDADALFTHNLRGISAAAWGMQNSRRDLVKIHYLHDYQMMCAPSSLMKEGRECKVRCRDCSLLTYGRRLMSKHVDIVYGASQFILERHLEDGFFPNALARVIEPPLQIDEADFQDYRYRDIRKFGYFGRIVPDKGIIPLIEAFSSFRSNLPDDKKNEVELIIGGSGEKDFTEQVVNHVNSSSGIRYVGVKSPDEYFPLIDMLVVPSVWPDPNPFVVVEAYQHGKPVIGAHVGGIIKSVIPGKTGLHFHHDPNHGSLIDALRQSWEGIAFSGEEMNRLVKLRNHHLAVAQLIEDLNGLR